MLLDFKLYYKAILIKIVRYRQKNRSMNRIENWLLFLLKHLLQSPFFPVFSAWPPWRTLEILHHLRSCDAENKSTKEEVNLRQGL